MDECSAEKPSWCRNEQVCELVTCKVQCTLSGPTDWIQRSIRTYLFASVTLRYINTYKCHIVVIICSDSGNGLPFCRRMLWALSSSQSNLSAPEIPCLREYMSHEL